MLNDCTVADARPPKMEDMDEETMSKWLKFLEIGGFPADAACKDMNPLTHRDLWVEFVRLQVDVFRCGQRAKEEQTAKSSTEWYPYEDDVTIFGMKYDDASRLGRLLIIIVVGGLLLYGSIRDLILHLLHLWS